METNQNNKIIGVALASLVMGAIAGILLAPKSGKETREDLAKISERIRDDIAHKLSQLQHFTRETYNEVIQTVVNNYHDAKEVTADEAAALKDELDKNYDQAKEAYDQDRQHLPGNHDRSDAME